MFGKKKGAVLAKSTYPLSIILPQDAKSTALRNDRSLNLTSLNVVPGALERLYILTKPTPLLLHIPYHHERPRRVVYFLTTLIERKHFEKLASLLAKYDNQLVSV